MSTQFTDGTVVNNVLVSLDAMLGFGATGTEPATTSANARMINTAGDPGAAAAPSGSLALANNGVLYCYTGSDWVTLGGAGGAVGQLNPDENIIPPPGAGGAVPNNVIGNVSFTVAAGVAETRTILLPTQVGLRVLVSIASMGAGGTTTLVAGGTINQAGQNTMTFNNVADTCTLQSFNIGGTTSWRIVENDGVALS